MKILRLKRLGLRCFLRDRKGASALEFAIVGAPFLLLLIGLFDIALLYIGNFALEQTVSEAARFIRTGQAQQWGETAFKNRVCANAGPVLDCSHLSFDVRVFPDWAAVELTPPIDKEKSNQTYSYEPGARNEIVVVRAFYEWPFLKNFPTAFDPQAPGSESGKRTLVATAAFRNEPF